MEPEEIKRLNQRAAEIYFGQDWHTGVFKFPPAYKFDEPHCSAADIANAGTIVVRLLREAMIENKDEEISRVLALAEFYLRALLKGDHFHSAMVFSDEFIPILPPANFEEKVAILHLLHARALRMNGRHEAAKEILQKITEFPFSTANKQSALVNLALCHDELDEKEDAKKYADAVVRLDRHSSNGMQARALLIELENSDSEGHEKLIRFENLARRNGNYVVANNIALLRANEAKDSNKVREILAPVVSPKKGEADFYNRTRAALKLAQLSLDAGNNLKDSELRYLVGAYYFLFNERMAGLFDRGHDALWRAFERRGETVNLLALFRLSSLYWRLRGRENKEVPYLQALQKILVGTVSERLSDLNREAAYYSVRSSTQLVADVQKQTNNTA